jgi:hypothetical protein
VLKAVQAEPTQRTGESVGMIAPRIGLGGPALALHNRELPLALDDQVDAVVARNWRAKGRRTTA